ncbi:MAG TPA: ferredoxin-type protein NapF [Gammaproteobacteria bacterium]|nr:ferredoxin-type protein NapF [Gammaproteobacteria bacterium]
MVKKNISRIQFLRGDYRGRETVIRPPWSRAEETFVQLCTRCGDCLNICPEKILKPGRGGFPQIDFARGECNFCQECQKICTQAAFLATDQRPWFYHVEFNERCLSRNAVVCVTCAEQCEAQAIQFVPRVGNVHQPRINISTCSGCGACYRSCPVGAIQFQKSHAVFSEQPSQRVEAHP